MKITCPECTSHFDVPADMFKAGPRRVRCNSCGHIWMQEPVDESALSKAFQPSEDSRHEEPIPSFLHPDLDLATVQEEVSAPLVSSSIHWGYLGRMLAGFACGAILVCAMAYGYNASVQPPIVAEDVKAEMKKDSHVINVTGKITNTSDQAMQIPDLELVPIDADDIEGEGQRLALSLGVLDAGSSADFSSNLPDAGRTAVSVRLRFYP